VFRAAESLSVVEDTYVNHAHNEYLELAIEGGLPAILLLLIFIGAFAAKLWSIAGRASGGPWLQRLAALAVAVMLLHSLIDYPMRTITTQALFAYLCALLFLKSSPGRAA
jgi:O-antigen ligase